MLASRLYSTVAAISLLLCVTAVALWARSMSRWDRLAFAGQSVVCEVMSEVGFLDVSFARRPQEYPTGWLLQSYPLSADERRKFSILRPTFGLEFYRLHSVPFSGVKISYWALVLLTALLPIRAGLAKLRRRRRAASGLCSACGYDLRASPDRCPECGAVPVGSAGGGQGRGGGL